MNWNNLELPEVYYKDNCVTQYHNNALTILRGIESNTMDLLCTDPPYGISFMGKSWDKALPDKEIWKECLRVLKPGAFAFVMSIPRSDCLSRMVISLEDAGFRVDFTPIYWAFASGFPKAQNISKAVDKRLGFEREVVGKQMHSNIGNNWEYKYQAERDNTLPITIPSTPQAKALDGSYGGFQSKPAVEVIIVAMKPLSEKTYVDQALKNRHGITWLDDCRVPYESDGDKNSMDIRHYTDEDCFQNVRPKESKFQVKPPNQSGRFPANLICSDDVLNTGKDIGYGNSKEPYNYSGRQYDVEGFIKDNSPQAPSNYGDSGSFSRYFSLDKWWEERIKQLPKSVQKTFPFLITPKASKSEKNKGLEELPKKQKVFNGQSLTSSKDMKDVEQRFTTQPTKNTHPTVKPLKLMSYLITLGSRKGDLILDPFMGSGTTPLAAKLLNRKCIGIELEEKYCEISKMRCSQQVLDLR